MKKKEILEELYNNYMDSTSVSFDRKKPDYLNIQKIFPKDKYHRILVEVRESETDTFVFKEYGYLSTKNNDFIIYCCLSTNKKSRDFVNIKTFNMICQIKGFTSITLLSDKNSFKYFLMSNQLVESGVPKLIIKTPVLPKLIGG